jgi:hypothetical protein
MNSSRICLYASGCLQRMPSTRPTLCNFSNRFGVMLDAAVDWQSTLIGASLLAIQKRFTISCSVRRVERNSMGAPYARITRVCDARSVLKRSLLLKWKISCFKVQSSLDLAFHSGLHKCITPDRWKLPFAVGCTSALYLMDGGRTSISTSTETILQL